MTRDNEAVDTAALVKQAADHLLRERRAREITVRAIHNIIGYGSSTTINNALASLHRSNMGFSISLKAGSWLGRRARPD